MLFQVRTARSVTSLATATREVGRSGGVVLASCVVVAVTAAGLGPWATVAVLTPGAALQVAAGTRHSAGSWQIGFASPGRPDRAVSGLLRRGRPGREDLGPLLVTTLLVAWGVPGWFVLGGIFLLAAAATKPVARWAERARAAASASTHGEWATAQ
uniref:Gra-orf35 protein n=1 Tax=Streptomyces violaceoruber TaxID=1935 RepID=Q9ZA24_STRVN|nr:gra-orf35 [Streptomyces violaceoruber]